MTELSRIEKRFYLHPKARRARKLEPGSISLWLFANCFCRDHRAQGFITSEQALELGSEAEIKALVVSGLWREVAGGYEFNDWLDWNPDLIRKGTRSSAAQIVWDVLSDHPTDARMRLAREVEKLIDEGVPRNVIDSALTKWGQRSDARVTWLPFFVSDAIREGGSGLHGAIKNARETGNMTALAEHGYRWTAPDLPPRMSLSKAREFIRQKKSEFLDQVEAGLRSDAAAQ
jgi:hypothetical protein